MLVESLETRRLLSVATFAPAHAYRVGSLPSSIAVGDFNGDGYKDMAVANNGNGTVGFLLGRGDGTFLPRVKYGVAQGVGAQSIAVADFNADGKSDLVVATGGASVSVLSGRGDGTFRPSVEFSAGNSVTSVKVGDFNGDGRTDIAVPNSDTNQVSVLLNNTARPTNHSLSKTTVRENKPVGTVVGTFSANDPNPSPVLTYALVPGRGSADNALFVISGNQLKTNAVFDFEARQTFSIRVRVVDRTGVGNVSVFTISVLNVNEAPTAIRIGVTQ